MLPLTVLILTHNEAANIEPCLRALASVDDVVIVDSGSRDETVERARQVRPDVRIFSHPFEDFGAQRNWAIDHTQPRHPWLLFVDADEYCEPALLDEIAALMAAPGEIVGGFVAGRNYFLGSWLRYSTMYPSYQLRLLKLGQVRYRKEGHGQREVTDGPLHYLRNGWRHESFSKGVHQWMERHNQYATAEAERILTVRRESIRWSSLFGDAISRRRFMRQVGSNLPFRPWLRFAYAYFLRLGFLDGRAGLQYCLLLLSYHLLINAKIEEISSRDAGG